MKRRLIGLFSILMSLFVSINVYAENVGDNFCDDNNILNVIGIFGWLLFVARLAVPLIIVIRGTLDMYKAVFDGTGDGIQKSAKSLLIRVFIGLLVFFIPALTEAVLPMFFDETIAKCESCLFYPSLCGQIVKNDSAKACDAYSDSETDCKTAGCDFKCGVCVMKGKGCSDAVSWRKQERENECVKYKQESTCLANDCYYEDGFGCHFQPSAAAAKCEEYKSEKKCTDDYCSWSGGKCVSSNKSPYRSSKSVCKSYPYENTCIKDGGCEWKGEEYKCWPKEYEMSDSEKEKLEKENDEMCADYYEDRSCTTNSRGLCRWTGTECVPK